MKPHVRAAAAAIALAHSRQAQISSIYSYAESSHRSIRVIVNGNRINAYDYARSCHITGQIGNLYDYGVSKNFNLRPTGTGAYNGYDYDSASHFTVRVNGRNVQVYDYEHSSHFNYSG